MNIKPILIVIILIVALGGGFLLINKNGDESESQSSLNTPTKETAKDESSQTANTESADTLEDSTPQPQSGSFITLADFNADRNAHEDNNKVLFFHAAWCSICKGIENEITSDPNRIPDSTTFIKTDFDNETALRQTHGVTTQYTFVQINNDGDQIAKWSATSLDRAIAGIQ